MYKRSSERPESDNNNQSVNQVDHSTSHNPVRYLRNVNKLEKSFEKKHKRTRNFWKSREYLTNAFIAHWKIIKTINVWHRFEAKIFTFCKIDRNSVSITLFLRYLDCLKCVTWEKCIFPQKYYINLKLIHDFDRDPYVTRHALLKF